MFRKASFFCGLFLFFATLANGENTFPYLGVVTADKIHVRAGPDVNFESLCQVNAKDEVVVLSKNFTWYKIKLPLNAPCFVSDKYLRVLGGDVATITAHRVNVRARPNEKSAVLGQLNDGIKVRIKGQATGWFQIEPVEGIAGWVADKYVAFKSSQIPPAQVVVEPSPVAETNENPPAPPVIATEPPKEQKTAEAPAPSAAPAVPAPGVFSVTGILKNSGRVWGDRDIHYKIYSDDNKIYFLKGDQNLINNFVGFKVNIEGSTIEDKSKRYKYPILFVQIIHLL